MKKIVLLAGLLLLAGAVGHDAPQLKASPSSGKRLTTVAAVVTAAQAFYATLTTAQQTTLVQAYTKANAIKWSNLPCGSSCRLGLQLTNLSTTQKAAAAAVAQAATGTTTNEGFSEAMQIRSADDVLGVTSPGGYDADIYFIAFLGTPSTTGTWQLQFGGHHLAINKTYVNGVETGATPQFEGVEPKTFTAINSDVPTVSTGVVYSPLSDEHDRMASLIASLTTAQKATAKLTTTFSDVLLGPNKDGMFPTTKLGIPCSSLSTAQKALVLAAMKPWVLDDDDTNAAAILEQYASELNSTYISYAGTGLFTTNTDYARLDGPHVWIEYVCQTGVVYNNQIHYHSIWRDHTGDYGNNFTF